MKILIRNRLLFLMVLFLFLPVNLQSASNKIRVRKSKTKLRKSKTKPKKSKTKFKKENDKNKKDKTKEETKKEEIITKEMIFDYIDMLKFSEDINKKKKAHDFLFDHIDLVESYLYKELLEPGNDDIYLANLFLIIYNSNRKIDLNKFIQSAELNINNPNYMFYLLSNYLYKEDQKKTIEILNRMLNSKILNQMIASLKIIKVIVIPYFKNTLIKRLMYEDSYIIVESLLNALSVFKLNESEQKKIVYYMYSIDGGVREASVKVLRSYPSMLAYLMDRFDDSDDFFEKISIIDTISHFKNVQADYFLVSLLDDELFQDKVLEAFLSRERIEEHKNNISLVKRLIKIYEGDSKTILREAIIRVMSFIFEELDKKGKIKVMDFYRNILNNEEDERIIYSVCAGIFHTGFIDKKLVQFLSNIRKKTKSWRIKKILRQILDLNNEN